MIRRDFKKPNLKEAFFNVVEEPIYLRDRSNNNKRIPIYKAIIDEKTRQTFSIVTNQYNLILNEKAYQLADIVIRGVFPQKRSLGTGSGHWG